MCLYFCFHSQEESINQKLNSAELRKNMTFFEKLELWMFFHTHPSIPQSSKHNTKQKKQQVSEVVTNPLREEAIDVIIGDCKELHEFY